MSKILIMDTFNYFHRAYHAFPVSLTDPSGNPVNAVYGVASMLISIFDLTKPDYFIAALESEEKTERKKHFEAYKAQRKPLDEALKVQIPILLELLEAFGLCTLTSPGYEGDDIIGTLVKKYSEGNDIVIASNDRDLWQLIKGGVMVMSPRNTANSADWISTREVIARFGFGPDTIVDYKALTGDPSDNIPGVSGIGQVTAKKLLIKYGSLEALYGSLDEVSEIMGQGIARKLEEGKESALLSKELAQVQMDLDLDFSLEDSAFAGLDKDSVKKVLEKYAFYSLLRRVSTGGEPINTSDDINSPGQLGLF